MQKQQTLIPPSHASDYRLREDRHFRKRPSQSKNNSNGLLDTESMLRTLCVNLKSIRDQLIIQYRPDPDL